MKQLLKATAILGSATVIATCLKIVTTKFLAVFIGPLGIGVFYQMVYFVQLMDMFTCFGMRMGVTKYLSEFRTKQDDQGIRVLVLTCMVSLLLFSIFSSLTAYIFAATISRFLFGTSQYAHYVRFVVLAVPVGVLMELNQGILFGFRMVKPIAAFKIAESVLTAAVFLPLIYYLGLSGAMIGIITTLSIQFALSILLLKRYSPIPLSFNIFKWTLIKFRSISKVIQYGSVTLIITFFRDLILTIFFRRLIILHLGIEANGIYSPAYGFSLQMVLLVSTAVYAYSFSKISEAKEISEISSQVNELIRTLLLIMTPVIFLLIGFRKQLILLMYTDKFLPVTQVLPVQFIGDFFKLLVWAISLPIHARADLKGMLCFEIGIYIFFYLTARSLIPSMGLMGAGWSYLLLYLVYFVAVTPYVIKRFDLKFERKNLWIIGTSFSLLLIGCQLKMGIPGMIFSSVVLLSVWAGLTLTRGEWKFGLEKSREYAGKVTQYLKSR